MEIYEKIKTIKSKLEGKDCKNYFLTLMMKDGKIERKRPFISSDGVLCFYRQGARRYGYRVSSYADDLGDLFLEEKKKNNKSDEQRWLEGWMKVKTRLEKSGLWEDLLKNIDLALEIGYEKIKEANKAYWTKYDDLSYQEALKKKIEAVEKIDKRLLIEGNINTEILWHIGYLAQIKKMNFGKYNNEKVLSEIAEAMKEKKDFRTPSYQASYDVSFSYQTKENRAWYSEEYRNCGNGHYYLAIDKTHALFYEND